MNRLLDLAARNMPPPGTVALPVRLCPAPVRRPVMERLLNHLLRAFVDSGEFEYLENRCLAVEITDMNLRWVVTARRGKLETVDEHTEADSTIRGRAVEFLLLAGRLEDPDTLFFQRRLEVSGDTVVGLTTRNLLDRLPFDELPLGLRIVVNRAARFGRRVRACSSRRA